MIYLRPEVAVLLRHKLFKQPSPQLAAPAELKVHADLIQILGSGETARLEPGGVPAVAHRFRRKEKVPARNSGEVGAGRLLNTPGILILAFSNGIHTVEDADHAKASLSNIASS
jgi:hypothetical protein